MVLGTYVNLYEADTKAASKLEALQPGPVPAVFFEDHPKVFEEKERILQKVDDIKGLIYKLNQTI